MPARLEPEREKTPLAEVLGHPAPELLLETEDHRDGVLERDLPVAKCVADERERLGPGALSRVAV